MNLKTLGALALLAALTVGSDAAVAANRLRVALATLPRLEEPQTAQGVDEYVLAQALYEGLTELTPDNLEPVGAVASSWKVGVDGTTYLFFLREEARWNNGKPVTADDFIAGWRRVLERPHSYADAFLLLRHVRNSVVLLDALGVERSLLPANVPMIGAEALGDKTLKVTLSRPIDHFLHLASLPLFFPRPQWLKRDYAMMVPGKTEMHGNGAFVLKEVEAERLLLEKNPHYWGRRQIQLDEVELRHVAQPEAVLQLYTRREIDWTGTVNLASLPRQTFKGRKDIVRPGRRQFGYFEFVDAVAFADPALRRAMSATIHRALLQSYVVDNALKGTVGFFPRASSKLGPHYALPYDRAAAQRELREAGYCDTPSIFQPCKQLPPVEIRHAEEPLEKKLALAVADMWRQGLGMNCRVHGRDEELPQASERAAVQLRWLSPQVPVVYPFLERWASKSGKQYSLLLEELYTRSPRQRVAVLKRVEKLAAAEMPVLPLVEFAAVGFVDPAILGFYNNRLDIHPLKHIYFKPGRAVSVDEVQ